MDRRTFLGGAVAGSAAAATARVAATKGEVITAQFVIVELFGYKKLCGRLTQGFAGLLQLEIPAPGGFVTQYLNPASVYRITVVDEPTVKALAVHIDPLPSIELELPTSATHIGFDPATHGTEFTARNRSYPHYYRDNNDEPF